MEVEFPKYSLYFNLEEGVYYDTREFPTIRKLIKNLLDRRYYTLEVQIQFNDEILNYESIKKQMHCQNIMLLFGLIDEELVEDMVYEISSVLGSKEPLRRSSYNDFNQTGYSDEQLNEMYRQLLYDSSQIEVLKVQYEDKFGKLANEFIYTNLAYLDQDHFLEFCNEFVRHQGDLSTFEMLQDATVCEALFKHMEHLIHYLDHLDYEGVYRYYQKDAIKILRNVRSYVKNSEDYNDNIKELLLYKFILSKFGVQQFFFDPEEGFHQIRQFIYDRVSARTEALNVAFEERVHLFKNNYTILSYSDPESKMFYVHRNIAKTIKKYFDSLKPFMKCFRMIENNFTQFNSKQNNQEEINLALELFMKAGIVKDYQEKFGSYSITIESGEHIPFLQGRWFEYYTASVCEDIILNFKQQGYFPDYGIYQNVLVTMNGLKRELDIIIYLNGRIFYIENKIENKNSIKADVAKYHLNSESMNITANQAYLVYLEGEDIPNESIRIYSLGSFLTRFKKEALKILEEDRGLSLQRQQDLAVKEKQEREINKILEKEKRSLYLNNHFDEEEEAKRLEKVMDRYREDVSKLKDIRKEDFFDEMKESLEGLKNVSFLEIFEQYKEKYQDLYLRQIKKVGSSTVYSDMIADLEMFGDCPHRDMFKDCLLCLNQEFETFFTNGVKPLQYRLTILRGYANNSKEYIHVLYAIMNSGVALGSDISGVLLIDYIQKLDQRVLMDLDVVEALVSIIRDYSNQISKIVPSIPARDQMLLTRKEKEFLYVLITSFATLYMKEWNPTGLTVDNPAKTLVRLLNNQELFAFYLKKDATGKKLSEFFRKKLSFHDQKYVDLSSYLFLNEKLLAPTLEEIKKCKDTDYVFEIPRCEVSNKFLTKCMQAGILSAMKEVKKADKFIAIFANRDAYEWLVQKLWIGINLTFTYEASFEHTNIEIEVNQEKLQIVFIKKMNRKVMILLGKMIRGKFRMNLLVSTNMTLLNDLKNFDPSTLIYGPEEIKEQIERIIRL